MATEIPASLAIEIKGNLRGAADDVLTLAAKSGNGSAFVELSRRHSKWIQLQIYRILGNWEDTEDALQDSSFKAFKHLNEFRGACKFSSWLTKIAINSALMVLRKRKAHPETSYDRATGSTELLDFWDFPDLSACPERLFAGRETDDFLQNAIVRLPWCYRSVVELFYTKGCSTIETARVMGISVAAAKSRLLRARIALRESLPGRTLDLRSQRMARPCLRSPEISKRRSTQRSKDGSQPRPH
jgi:RNA polymerase sigma-70 factor (ECF subfamily)